MHPLRPPGQLPTPGSSSESSRGAGNAGLRPLLPAPRRQSSTPGGAPTQVLRRRRQVTLACESCRRRKTKCNAARPRCSQCQARRIECIYREPVESDLRQRFEAMQESHPAVAVYRAMQTRPESEAFEIFRLIRAGADPETIMRQLTTADLLLQVHLVPESRYRYQFPYSSQMPAYLQSPNNEFMKSMVYEWNAGDNPRPSQPLSPNDEKFKAHYLKPFHAATIVDTRLAEIVPSRYTTVHADDSLMRTLLHAYFL